MSEPLSSNPMRFTAHESIAPLVASLGQAIKNGAADLQDVARARRRLEEQADEIERLTAELAEARAGCRHLVAERDRLKQALLEWTDEDEALAGLRERDRLLQSVWAEQVRAGNAESECVRLRAALEKIIAPAPGTWQADIAREALAAGSQVIPK